VTQAVASWGRLSHAEHRVVGVGSRSDLAAVVAGTPRPGLPFGNGRSYGDVCLNGGHTLWRMRDLDRFIAFDASTGILECEAGVLLHDVIELALPQGWFLPVTPGTRFATIGGAIANDVHGKNHHRQGTFGEHVETLRLVRTDGSQIVCGPRENAQWFAATVGGMGLTGAIASATLRLRPVSGAWIESRAEAFRSLDDFFQLSRERSAECEYTVAWIDCQTNAKGDVRGIFFSGDHSSSAKAPAPRATRRMPVDPPVSVVNNVVVRVFNAAYFARQARSKAKILQDYRSFFYPLDDLLDWNRLYGLRGFYQYQCVVPSTVQIDATKELLRIIGGSGHGSFLGVLKTFDDRPPVGMLSFPMAGTTLALDFPNRSGMLELFGRLDAVVASAGGRVYAAKDAVSPRSLFERGYPAASAFARYRDPGIASDMSRRLFGH
jgi:FAD/FMN-containing dehydrogenase